MIRLLASIDFTEGCILGLCLLLVAAGIGLMP